MAIYIVERDHAPIAHILRPRSSPEQISTQPHDSLWFDYCTTEDTDSTEEDPDIRRVNRTPLYVTNHVSTFLWDHNEVGSAQINSGSDTGRRNFLTGESGTAVKKNHGKASTEAIQSTINKYIKSKTEPSNQSRHQLELRTLRRTNLNHRELT